MMVVAMVFNRGSSTSSSTSPRRSRARPPPRGRNRRRRRRRTTGRRDSERPRETAGRRAPPPRQRRRRGRQCVHRPTSSSADPDLPRASARPRRPQAAACTGPVRAAAPPELRGRARLGGAVAAAELSRGDGDGAEAFSAGVALTAAIGPKLLRSVGGGGGIGGLVDPRLGAEYDAEEAAEMVKLAAACVAGSPSLRPSMAEVVPGHGGEGVQVDLSRSCEIERQVRFVISSFFCVFTVCVVYLWSGD
uniref:Uncharacterized protein n=1 Tax=Ananas comosus var. bracteatus TaxID=296719 RepID=A0A6V7NPN5_ANACO|nr:unnamed protein product [Ananas comosus var. bracteatus]